MKTLKQELTEGNIFEFTNDNDFCTVQYMKTLSGQKYYIINFNSKIVKMTKTFKPFENKLNELIIKYNLNINN